MTRTIARAVTRGAAGRALAALLVLGAAGLAAPLAAQGARSAGPAAAPRPPTGDSRTAAERTAQRAAATRSGQSRSVEDRSTASRQGTRVAGARGPVQCEKCHADRQFLVGKAKSERGDSVLFVPDTLLRDSRHQTLVCADCHVGYNDGYPHVTVPAVAIGCEDCHDDQSAAWKQSVHAPTFVKNGDAATCVSCHSSHRVLASDDPRSPTYPLNVARLCGSCHNERRIIGKYFEEPADSTARAAAASYKHSVHGLAMTDAGLVVSATCSDCHDAHRVLPHDSTASTLGRGNVTATCGACHAGVLAAFDSSAHGQALVAGDTTDTGHGAPVCVDCHGGHTMVAANDPVWFRGVVTECGDCHERLTRTYFGSYHGKATELGYDIAAKCSDCHTAHAMHSAKDTLSSVHPRNLVETCSKCHEGANANFVQYLAHADPQDREKNPIVFWVWVGMTTLLTGVLTFFALHSGLWFVRAKREGPHGGHAGRDGPDAQGGGDDGPAGEEEREPATVPPDADASSDATPTDPGEGQPR